MCKKDKKHIVKRLIVVPDFNYFYIGHIKSRLFLKRLCRHVGPGDVHKTFFLEIFKYFENKFQIMEANALARQKPLSTTSTIHTLS
jgi:hypothetical protein